MCVGVGSYPVGPDNRSLIVEVSPTAVTATGLFLAGAPAQPTDSSTLYDVVCKQDNTCIAVGNGTRSANR